MKLKYDATKGMNPRELTTADLLAMLQCGTCIDSRDGMSLTSATEPLRTELRQAAAYGRLRELLRQIAEFRSHASHCQMSPCTCGLERLMESAAQLDAEVRG